MPANSKTLIGAIIAAVLAVAVYYGFIGRQTAANQTLGTSPPSAPAPQAPTAPVPQNPAAPTATTTGPAPQNAPQTPRP